MTNTQKSASWMGRPIVDPADAEHLEMASAIHEFGNKMPRKDAEERAHNEYIKDSRLAAAAHHLQGAKAAHAVGEMEQARKHGVLYEVHMKSLGMNPTGPVPQEVMAKMASADRQNLYRFKPHKGDLFAVAEHKKEEPAKEEDKK